ncbi:hypothetical protein CAG37_008480 [Serratia nematodiphila]|nr:hypothetical protein CAG37_008480 [Serratia nematodiphila]
MGEICQINWIKKGKKMKKLPQNCCLAAMLAMALQLPYAHGLLTFNKQTMTLVGTTAWSDISGPGTPGAPSQCYIILYIDDSYYSWKKIDPNCYYADPEGSKAWLKNLIANGVQLQYAGPAVNAGNKVQIGNEVAGPASWRLVTSGVSLGSSVVCYMDGAILLDHGLMAENDAGGATTHSTATIDCDGEAEVKLTIKPSNVKMTNGMTARVLVQGKSSKKIKVGDGETTVDISSELNGKPEQAGAATGSTVLQYEVL